MKLPWNKEHADLEREVAYHVETLADGFEAAGMSRAEALMRARREFGGVERVKEECRAESRWSGLIQFQQDLRFGWRMIRKSPTISIAAIASLALGIGATTAIYSLADAILWRKLAVPNPEQIVELHWESKSGTGGMIRNSSGSSFPDGALRVSDFFSRAAFETMQQRSAGKLGVTAHIYAEEVSCVYRGDVTVAHVRAVAPNFFTTLRLQPFAGRLFDSEPNAPEVVVTYAFWERALGRSEKVIGETIRINNRPFIIAGVLAQTFIGVSPGDGVELYTTISHSPSNFLSGGLLNPDRDDPFRWWMQLIVRRSPDISIQQAQARIDSAFAASWPVQPKTPEQTPRIRLVDASTGLGGLRRQLGSPVATLLGLASLVLLVACANIANLLLARSAEREKEVGVRVSLGCGSKRLMRQFLTESLLLALLGGALSLAVAVGIGTLMKTVLPVGLNTAALTLDLNLKTLSVTLAVTVLTALVFGLYPAWRASRVDAAPALKEGTGSAGSMSRGRLVPARLLVLAQVAVGVLLVTAAILYTGNLSEIVRRDAGFERGHTLLFDVRPGQLGYADARLDTFYRTVADRLREIPGVVEVGLSRIRPMRGGGYHDDVRLPGSSRAIPTAIHQASSGFLPALGVPLVLGRAMTQQEVTGERQVAVISERLAKELGLSAPLGARILQDGREWEVVGVAKDARYSRLTQSLMVTYLPMPKAPQAVTVLLRTSVKPEAVIGAAREAIRSVDANVPLVDVFTMEQQISRTLQRERMFAWLCGSFGVLALVLCVVGVYGLMSHATARRTPEIGIRVALGATARQVMRQVLGEGMRLSIAGMLIGVPLALYAAKTAQKLRLLPEGPIPYWTLGAAIAILVVSTFMAVFGPALRASSVDPMRALRQG